MLSYINLKAQITPWLDASIKGNYNYYGISTMQKEYGTGVNYSGGGYYGRGGSTSGGYNMLGLLHSGHGFMNDDLTVDLMIAGEVYGNTESQSWSKGKNGGWGSASEFSLMNNTWVSFREVTLGYRLPESIVQKLHLQQFRVSVSARNIGYLCNGLKDHLNPESISSNNPLTPFDIGSVPFCRTYSLSLNVKF